MANTHHYRAAGANIGKSSDVEETRQSDTGDLLNGIGSASSHNSTASSLFSTNANSVRHNGKMSAYASTPLTSSDASPPKASSPYPSKSERNHNQASPFVASAASTSLLPPSHPASAAPSPPHNRPQARPPQGEAKGYRAVWDPELDSKLGKEEKRKMKPKVKSFGAEVRPDNFKISCLSLCNTIHCLKRNRSVPCR